MSRRAGLQGPIIEGLSSTTSSFERRNSDQWLQYADFFEPNNFGPDQELTSYVQSGLMLSITAFMWASCVALND